MLGFVIRGLTLVPVTIIGFSLELVVSFSNFCKEVCFGKPGTKPSGSICGSGEYVLLSSIDEICSKSSLAFVLTFLKEAFLAKSKNSSSAPLISFKVFVNSLRITLPISFLFSGVLAGKLFFCIFAIFFSAFIILVSIKFK